MAAARHVLGYVYVAQAGAGGPVKIGWAMDVGERIKRHQTSCPEQVDLIAAFPGTKHLERAIHKRFATYRHRGEWFAPKVVELLEQTIRDTFIPLSVSSV